jgi:hypothetical protein
MMNESVIPIAIGRQTSEMRNGEWKSARLFYVSYVPMYFKRLLNMSY